MNKKTSKTLFSSTTDLWSTPQKFYNELNEEFDFTLDPCATDENFKCPKYFTEKDDGLTKSWKGHIIFMNPPYGKHIKKWLKKAYEESLQDNTLVVCLIPSRTDTKYWHDYCMKAKEIRFVKGRLKFGNSKNSAPFPSVVVIFHNGNINPLISSL